MRLPLSTLAAAAIADFSYRPDGTRPSFQHELARDEPEIVCRPFEIIRVFGNLLRNAFTARADATVRTSYTWDAQQVSCTVEDDGPGFPTWVLAGEPPPDGLVHLGLSVIRDIVRGHRGAVELRNGNMGGARIVMRLPVAEGTWVTPADVLAVAMC